MDARNASGAATRRRLNDGGLHQERLQLIPRECATAKDGTAHFQAVFEARYHHPAPVFVGSLQAAIEEAFEGGEGRKATEQRPLALYIHHDGSHNRDRFPKEVLCSYQVLGLLRTQFLVWPWDVSEEENEERLANWMSECGLGEALSTVSLFLAHPDRFPLLLLFSRYNGELQMIDFVGGFDTAAAAREKLIACTRALAESKAREVREAKERAARAKADHIASLKASLPAEPAADAPDACLVRFRLPKERQMQRRFSMSTPLSVLFTFLESEGFPLDDYRMMNSDFPVKKEISEWGPDSTLAFLKMTAREVIYVEKK